MTFRIQKKWRWAVAAAAIFVPGIVTGALSLPFTFSAGKPIRASEVNANFEALRAQIDVLSGAAARPPVGTLTLAGIVTAVPIRKFTQSVSVPFTGGAATAKPSLSDIQVILDVGASSPQINSTLALSKAIPTADIVLGNFTVHLTNLALSHSTVGPAQAGVAQDTLSLSYKSVDWSWQVGTAAKRTVSFNVATSTGGGSGVKSFSYGYFAPGVDPDPTFLAIAGYTHDISCPVGAKCVQGALSVQKALGSETLDELGLATTNTSGLSVDLEWFLTAGTASNTVQLDNATIVGVALGTKDDGTFAESVDYAYQKITWKAGNVVTTSP